jgi:hypothetical protein
VGEALLRGDLPDGWGVDMWFLIEAAMHCYKIREVFLGTKDHMSFTCYEDALAKFSKMGEPGGPCYNTRSYKAREIRQREGDQPLATVSV